jgi:hypothetical protein
MLESALVELDDLSFPGSIDVSAFQKLVADDLRDLDSSSIALTVCYAEVPISKMG